MVLRRYMQQQREKQDVMLHSQRFGMSLSEIGAEFHGSVLTLEAADKTITNQSTYSLPLELLVVPQISRCLLKLLLLFVGNSISF